MTSKKVIGINALFLIPGEVGGTEYHLRSFLAALEAADTSNQYVVFCNHENFDSFNFQSTQWKKILCPVQAKKRLIRVGYEQLVLPFLAAKMGCDYLHSFGYWGTIINRTKQLITVHDTNWLDYPEDMSYLTRLVTKFLTETTMKLAHTIVTDSDFARVRLQHHFPSLTNKIQVVLPGIDPEFQEKLKAAKNLPAPHKKPYVLCVSALYPHKRIPYLLRMWKFVNQKNTKYDLILIGRRGLDEEQVLSTLPQLHNIGYLPGVSLSDLALYYAHASAFIFPSTYEGFGYPVYEALAANIPCFVGQTKLYQPDVRKFLIELHEDPQEDSATLLSLLPTIVQDSATYIKQHYQYHFSVKTLLTLYENN